jgi:phosphoribosyl 1,2-cyclic phosphate phosphodiesterase
MKVTFLGTGTSQGVPFIGCPCPVCTSKDPRNNRLRCAVWIETADTSIVIDSGPDFRYQMLRAGVSKLDAIIFTHGHKDHIAGLDDIRPYNFFTGKAVNIYATTETQESLQREFSYIFNNLSYPGIPQITMHTITPSQSFYINELEIVPIRLLHYKLEVLGFRIGDFTYITDANYIDPVELDKVRGGKALVLNALRHEAHISHFTLEQAKEVAIESGVPDIYFTHISHQLGLHHEVEATLPAGMRLAYDGLTLEF